VQKDHRYLRPLELRICRSYNHFDRAKLVWIDMLRNPSLSTAARLALGLLQLLELYNAWSVGKDQGVQLIL